MSCLKTQPHLDCREHLPFWQPKNYSSGSCDNLWLRNTLTPGTVKRYCVNSTNELTVKKRQIKILITKYHLRNFDNCVITFVLLPVIQRPCQVSLLRIINFFSVLVNPSLCFAHSSHLSRKPMKSSSIEIATNF